MKTTQQFFKTTIKNKSVKILLLLVVLGTTFTISSCRKDDDNKPPVEYAEENPLAEYLNKSGFGQKTSNMVDYGYFEFGLTFTPLVKGKIKSLTFKIPGAATNVRVTIWDATTKTVLRTETIASVTANTEVIKNITPLELEKDKKYAITYNDDSYYYRQKTDGSATTYPILTGNIRIDGYGYSDGATQTFPLYPRDNYYAGDLSFIFQQTE